ncbi:MAG: alpha/beta hydrolase family protein [Kiritimatiellia bacterium]|jgi:dienelactone hydrolase
MKVTFPIPEEVGSWPIPERETKGVKAVWLENVPWKGRATRFFAYYALPPGATAGKKVPGIVLVHGGGGTAFHRWVRTWNARGYAAIAMDTCGGLPGDAEHSMCHTRHAWSGPNGWGCFADEGLKPEEQWPYHAVETVIRSHTFLRSLPEVDAGKIGLTGISWGGVLMIIASGVDSRFAFAAPVYACGNLRKHSLWTPEIGARWDELWDPAQYARHCRVPTLWCTGTNDRFFPLDSFKETALSTGNPLFSIKVRMPHGQWEGDPPEIAAFADSIVKGAPKLNERKVVRREWISTDSDDPVWERRHFVASPNQPVTSTVCFENRVTEEGLVLSTAPTFPARLRHRTDGQPHQQS